MSSGHSEIDTRTEYEERVNENFVRFRRRAITCELSTTDLPTYVEATVYARQPDQMGYGVYHPLELREDGYYINNQKYRARGRINAEAKSHLRSLYSEMLHLFETLPKDHPTIYRNQLRYNDLMALIQSSDDEEEPVEDENPEDLNEDSNAPEADEIPEANDNQE